VNCTDADIIIIRGAPGSGKTQVAKRLGAFFPKGARVEVDALRAMVISVAWTDQEEHISLLSLAIDVVLDFLKLNYKPVILVDTFSGDKLTRFLNELHTRNSKLVVRSFALVTAPDVLKSRIESRVGNQFKDIEICQKLNADVLKFLQHFEQMVDTTQLSPEDVCQIILNAEFD
jgi:broad-specificity NMP kinase